MPSKQSKSSFACLNKTNRLQAIFPIESIEPAIMRHLQMFFFQIEFFIWKTEEMKKLDKSLPRCKCHYMGRFYCPLFWVVLEIDHFEEGAVNIEYGSIENGNIEFILT